MLGVLFWLLILQGSRLTQLHAAKPNVLALCSFNVLPLVRSTYTLSRALCSSACGVSTAISIASAARCFCQVPGLSLRTPFFQSQSSRNPALAAQPCSF